jgi:AcrR family transcriptional regulator
MTRETLSRDQVVEAAIAILDEEGYDALSMRRLAQRLGTAAPTLYWHVRNRDELLDLVADDIVGEILGMTGEPTGSRAWMTALARALRDVLGRHAGVAPIIGLRPLTGANASATLGRLLEALRGDGFEEPDAVLAATTLTGWASGFAVFEARDRIGTVALPGLPDADTRFEYGLAVLLDGIEAGARRRWEADQRDASRRDDGGKGKHHRKDDDRGKGKHHRKDDDRGKGDRRPR